MRSSWIAVALAGALAAACGRPPASPAPTPAPSPPPPAAQPAVTPSSGLGELMGLAQMRQSKLWFAAEAGNWGLAEYELDELNEGFEDVVREHPLHKNSPVPIDEAVRTIMAEPLAELARAIKNKDRKQFEKAFDTVTDGCNACHQATNHGFVVLRRPKTNPYSNQSFAPER